MKPFKALSAASILLLIVVGAQAQHVREFPPRLPPSFAGIPLDGGRVHSIAVNPRYGDEIIVAHQFGGLWKTTNGGATWQSLSNLSAVFAQDVAYAPNGNTVIATLGRDNGVNNGGGIWVSRRGGLFWSRPDTATPPPHPRVATRINAYGISYAPDDANKVYAGTDYGIALSEDNGHTWSHVMLENSSPVSRDKLQNAVLSVLALPGNRVLALCRTGVHRSDDGGRSWRRVRGGNFANGFKSIDVSPLDSDKVFVLQDYSNLLLYEMGSRRWTTIPLPGGGSRGPFVRVSRSASASNAIDIWVGAGVNLLKITRADIDSVRSIAAEDWTALHRAVGLHDDSGYLGLNSDKRPILYGSDGGLFKPTNPEATAWTRAASGDSGLNSYQITSLGGTNVPISPSVYRSSLYFATQDNGIWASSDGGTTWPYNDCAEGFHVQVRTDAARDQDVTVAYGKIGCPPSNSMLGDAHLANKRGVPDNDLLGNALSDMSQAFLISPNNYIRYRGMPDGSTGIYVSQNNGRNWRETANVGLEVRGVFRVSGPASNPTVYAPFKGALPGPGDSERVGLIKLTGVFAEGVRRYGEEDLIYLPDDGGLGLRATEFDWQAVYGVDPSNPDFIIAPDIHNQVVKVSTRGGASWYTDDLLTDRVKRGRALLLYDADPYHMQVTHISFDPYRPQRILVGTRDAGVIVSENGGGSWAAVPESQPILYVTGFFFRRDNTVVVSSYGRGLWTVDFTRYLGPIDEPHICYGIRCIIRFPPDVEKRFVIDLVTRTNQTIPRSLLNRDVTVVLNGKISGLMMSGNKVQAITVTPGSSFKSYSGDAKKPSELKVIETAQGAGFCGLKAVQTALQGGETINGVILKEGKLLAIISSEAMFREGTLQAGGRIDPPGTEPRGRPDEVGRPYLSVKTSVQMAGLPVLGKDGLIRVFAKGFNTQINNFLMVLIDGEVVEQAVKMMPDGSFMTEIRVPENLSYGEHTVQVFQTGGGGLSARSSFVKAAIDDFQER